MSLALSEDENLLIGALSDLLDRADPIASLRSLRDSGDLARTDHPLWQELIGAGFAAPQISAEAGGLGMGYAAAGLVSEQLGRTLAPVPFLSSAAAGEILVAADASDHLAALLGGTLIGALALDEGPRHAPGHIGLTASALGEGYRLVGSKHFVCDASIADVLIVVAALDDGIGLFVVPTDIDGLLIEPVRVVDSRNVANVGFEDVEIPAHGLILAGSAARVALARALDVTRILLAAELLGIAQAAFDKTVVYLGEREQFGRKIGSFQALQHRAARLFIALELARAVVMKALRSLDAQDPSVPALASLAKALLTETSRLVVNEAIQMHGGIGVTDDLDIGLFYKRARVAGNWLGDDYFHRERLAELVWKI